MLNHGLLAALLSACRSFGNLRSGAVVLLEVKMNHERCLKILLKRACIDFTEPCIEDRRFVCET